MDTLTPKEEVYLDKLWGSRDFTPPARSRYTQKTSLLFGYEDEEEIQKPKLLFAKLAQEIRGFGSHWHVQEDLRNASINWPRLRELSDFLLIIYYYLLQGL